MGKVKQNRADDSDNVVGIINSACERRSQVSTSWIIEQHTSCSRYMYLLRSQQFSNSSSSRGLGCLESVWGNYAKLVSLADVPDAELFKTHSP